MDWFGNVMIVLELIETLWNVNEGIQGNVSRVRRINRNIVECKLKLVCVFA